MQNRCVSCGTDLTGIRYRSRRLKKTYLCQDCGQSELQEFRETCCYCGKRDPETVRERIFRDFYGIPFAIGFFCEDCKPVPRED